jgi:opine dehydrogenase
MAIKTIAVLGAGNGGATAAGDLTLRGYDVRWYTRYPNELVPFIQRGGVEMSGAAGEGFAEIAMMTQNLNDAVEGADMIIIVIPTSGHGWYGEQLASLLNQDQIVFLDPGHIGGSLYFSTEVRKAGYSKELRICEVATLTYGCRMSTPTKTKVMHVTKNLLFSAFPNKNRDELYKAVKEVYKNIIVAENVLHSGFLDLNAMEHPPQILCNAGWVEWTKGDYCFYYEGTTPAVARTIEAIDRERISIANAIGVRTKTFVEYFFDAGYTSTDARNSGSVYKAMQDSEPNRYVKGPPSLDHRYVHEDVGFGLVPMSEFGRLAGIETPTMDALIQIASVMNGIDYRHQGLTLKKMGLDKIPLNHLLNYLETGKA